VFKRLDAPHTPGKPNSGGPQLKFKFCAMLSAVVAKIPNSKFLGGSDLLDGDPCFMSVQSSGRGRNARTHIRLETPRWIFITRDIDGAYPDWKHVVPAVNANWTIVKLNPPAASRLLQVIPKLPGIDGSLDPVQLRIERCLSIEGRNRDEKDWTKVAVPDVTITGKPHTLLLNRNYLGQALKFGFDEFAIEADCSPVVFTKAGRKFVIMPIRPDSAATSRLNSG